MKNSSRTFFQNKCSACVNSSKISSQPTQSSEMIDCTVGGRIAVAMGCDSFEPSMEATCSNCWNFSGVETDASCSVHGVLAQMREACPEAVGRSAS